MPILFFLKPNDYKMYYESSSIEINLKFYIYKNIIYVQKRYKNIENHCEQIIPSILYERSHNNDWSNRACLVD